MTEPDAVAGIIGRAKAYASTCIACEFQGEYTNGMLVAERERKEAFEDLRSAVDALVRERDLAKPVVAAAVDYAHEDIWAKKLNLRDAVDDYIAATAPPDGETPHNVTERHTFRGAEPDSVRQNVGKSDVSAVFG